jgi:ubiquitin carboxyl-terminal hydrolase 9/24
MNGTMEELHAPFTLSNKESPLNALSQEDVALCREALDVLALAVALFPQSLDNLCKDKSWHTFIIDLVIFSPEREIRLSASDQFLLIATR